MKNKSLIEVKNHVIKGRLKKAIELLIQYCDRINSSYLDEVITLSTNFHIIERKERIGLGEFNQELNRITRGILNILSEEDSNAPEEFVDSDREQEQRLSVLEDKIDQILEFHKSTDESKVDLLEKEYFWMHLEISSRNYLITAEKILELDLYDFSTVVLQYSKVLESEFTNKVIVPFKEEILIRDPSLKEPNSSRLLAIILKFGEKEITFSEIINCIIMGLQRVETQGISFKEFIDNRFLIVNKQRLIEELEEVKPFRKRAVHVGIMTKLESENFREKVLSILRNLLNRPYRVNK